MELRMEVKFKGLSGAHFMIINPLVVPTTGEAVHFDFDKLIEDKNALQRVKEFLKRGVYFAERLGTYYHDNFVRVEILLHQDRYFDRILPRKIRPLVKFGHKTEVLDFYFDSINRSAITVQWKQPFREWMLKIRPDNSPDFDSNHNAYLVDIDFHDKESNGWLEKNFEIIFENELHMWIQHRDLWPQKRSWDEFNRWFEVHYFNMVLDMEDEPIEKHSVD